MPLREDDPADIPRSSPLGEVRHVKAGPRGVPHTVTNVTVADGRVRFNGPAWSGQSEQYEAALVGAAEPDGISAAVDAAVRAAIEKRMYSPDAPYSVEPQT